MKSDNFFVLLFQALRQRRVPIALRIASHSLLLVVMALAIYAWVIGMQFKQAMHQQADALGNSLIIQTSASATELLVSNDILSLNVLLNNLVKNPLAAHAAIYSVDNRILAEAGTRPSQSILGETDGLYSTDIIFQDVIAGRLRISLDMQQFQQPMTISLQSMGILGLILLALTLALSLRLGRHISTPLMQLRIWLRNPNHLTPGADRNDEVGDLARQLQASLAPEAPEPEPVDDPEPDIDGIDDKFLDESEIRPAFNMPNLSAHSNDDVKEAALESKPLLRKAPAFSAIEIDDDDAFDDLHPEPSEPQVRRPLTPAAAPKSTQPSAVLAIQLGAPEQLRRLPRTRLAELLKRYNSCLEQASALYEGELYSLSDGSSLMLFHCQDGDDDYLTHAICCGELMRALGHALQIEVADSGITLQLQLGMTQGNNLTGLSQGELLLNAHAQDALALSQHSRNLLLVERSIAEDPLVRQRARIRSIASPEGASCVERLLEPYPSLLERQLARMHEAQ